MAPPKPAKPGSRAAQSATKKGSKEFFMEEGWDSGKKGKGSPQPESPEDQPDSPEAVRSPSFLPPGAGRSRWQAFRGAWFLTVLAILFVIATILLIYIDYQRTTRKQIAAVQLQRCLLAMDPKLVDQTMLSSLGIANPPPPELEAMESNALRCQHWRERLERDRPLTGWRRESLETYLKLSGN